MSFFGIHSFVLWFLLQVLSLAELRGVSFPKLKAKALTLETVISRYVIPGILRVPQNSPDLKKLTIHPMASPRKYPIPVLFFVIMNFSCLPNFESSKNRHIEIYLHHRKSILTYT